MQADPRSELERLADEIERRGVERPDTSGIIAGNAPPVGSVTVPGRETPVSIGQGPDGTVYVDHDRTTHASIDEAVAALGPKTFTLDVRPRVVIRIREITDGPVTGWQVRCDACPGFSTDRGKSKARKRAFFHGQKHDEQGHRAIIDEPLSRLRHRRGKRR